MKTALFFVGAWCVFVVVWISMADDWGLGLGLGLARWTGESGERGGCVKWFLG